MFQPVPLNGVSFHSEESMHKWKYVVQQRMIDEWTISSRHQSCTPVTKLIKAIGLMRIVEDVGPFYPRLIQELIVNFPIDFNDPTSVDF